MINDMELSNSNNNSMQRQNSYPGSVKSKDDIPTEQIDIDKLSFPHSASSSHSSLPSPTSGRSSASSSKSNSSLSISDTLLKVRRLTHVYDEQDDILLNKFKDLNPPQSTSEVNDDDIDSIATAPPDTDTTKECDSIDLNCETNLPIVEKFVSETNVFLESKVSTRAPIVKLGDKSYKLPTKAAAILGADDKTINQSLIPIKPQHALFLDNKPHNYKIKKTSSAVISAIDSGEGLKQHKKKIGIGTEVREKLVSFLKPGSEISEYGNSSLMNQGGMSNTGSISINSCNTLHMKELEKLIRSGKVSVDQIRSWSKSFETLLHDKFGLALFHDFLRSEFSDENIEFWIACEEFRTITNPKKLYTRAEKIYNDFVGVQAAREVNLDSRTRQQTELDILQPNCTTFDTAQKRIQALMEKDSYQRFLRSELYCRMLRLCSHHQPSASSTSHNFGNTPNSSSNHSYSSSIVSYPLSTAPIPSNFVPVNTKGPAISSLGLTAQDLSKLTMTTSKVALLGTLPKSTTAATNTNTSTTVFTASSSSISPQSSTKTTTSTASHTISTVSTVQPDETCLPFYQTSLLYSPDVKK